MLRDDAVMRKRRPVRHRVIGGEGVVLVQDQAHVVGLNATGAAVLEAIDGRRTIGDVVDLLVARFDADPGRIRAEVVALAEELTRLGVIEDAAPAPQEGA